MTPIEALKAIKSLDNHQAWLAGWEIIRTSSDEIKLHYLPHIQVIAKWVGELPHPGRAISDSREIPKLAVKILEAIQIGECRCAVYESTERLLPESEEKYGFIDIIEKRDIPWEPEFDCACKECGQHYLVVENHGYHYPWSKWRKSA